MGGFPPVPNLEPPRCNGFSKGRWRGAEEEEEEEAPEVEEDEEDEEEEKTLPAEEEWVEEEATEGLGEGPRVRLIGVGVEMGVEDTDEGAVGGLTVGSPPPVGGGRGKVSSASPSS